jgi:hypothetical protein
VVKIKTKRGKKVITVLAVIIGIIVCLNIIGLAINKIFFSHELGTVPPYGQIVEVNG